MTTTIDHAAPAAPARASGAAGRIRDVVRLHLVNPATIIVWPLVILAVIFVVNLVIWFLIWNNTSGADRADAVEGLQWSGAALYIFVYMMVVAVQAMNQTFGYALGMSVTRRDYYLGSAVAFVLLSAFYTTVLVVMGAIERATGGWGVGGRMFSSVYFGDGSLGQSILTIGAYFLFAFFTGSIGAAVFVRWRSRGLTAFLLGATLVVLAAIVIVTLVDGWPAFGAWFLEHGAAGLAGWLLVAAGASALAGFGILRGATPRS